MEKIPVTLDEFLETSFFKVLAEPARLRLMQLLWYKGQSDMSSLSREMVQDPSVVSRHLKILHESGIVNVEKKGRHKYYELESERLIEKLEILVAQVKNCLGGGCKCSNRKEK